MSSVIVAKFDHIVNGYRCCLSVQQAFLALQLVPGHWLLWLPSLVWSCSLFSFSFSFFLFLSLSLSLSGGEIPSTRLISYVIKFAGSVVFSERISMTHTWWMFCDGFMYFDETHHYIIVFSVKKRS